MNIDYDLLLTAWDAFSPEFFRELLPEDHGLSDSRIERIWEVAHMNINELRKTAGLTQSAMSKRFAIPLRTLENWCRGVSRPPEYVRFMLIDLLGLLDI